VRGSDVHGSEVCRLALLALVLVLVLPAAGAGGPGPSLLTEIHEVTADELSAVRTPAAAAATWCGAATERDRTPNVVAGHTVHWLYVTPLNEPDRFSTLASIMQTDAEAIDAWWRREDATRTPRNDLTQLTCGAQLDLTTRRLQVPASQFFGDFGFGQIFGQLEGDGFDSPFTKYVVYYDGPVPSSELDVCGRGGGDDDGIGLAVVYVRACLGVSTAAVLAHEVLHTLGAVSDAAPGACDGHVCGNPSDLMSPNIGGEPLEAKVLDAGRDDYYGHSGVFVDVRDAPWLVQLDRQRQLRLNVTGPGRVVADVPGLECAESCTTTWNASTHLNLAGTPAAGSKLVRWSGACRAGRTCAVTVGSGTTVGVLFAPRVFRLSVGVEGRGQVRAPKGIACRPRCSASLPSFVPARLTAAPAKGWTLRRWTGACRGKKPTCTVAMSKQTSARAVFVRVPNPAG
jgi:Divergent InlB B-repeat domain